MYFSLSQQFNLSKYEFRNDCTHELREKVHKFELFKPKKKQKSEIEQFISMQKLKKSEMICPIFDSACC